MKGARLPTLKQLLDQPALSWTTKAVVWYNGTVRTVEIASQTAVCYHGNSSKQGLLKPPVIEVLNEIAAMSMALRPSSQAGNAGLIRPHNRGGRKPDGSGAD